MKHSNNKTKQRRSFRRVIKQWLSSLLKCQPCSHKVEFEKIIQMLQQIDDSIEIVARGMARQMKRAE